MEKGNKKEIAAAVDPKTNLNSGFSVSPLILCRRVSLSLIFLALTLAILGCSVNHCDATALSMFPHPLLPPSPPVPVPENLVTQAHDTRSGLEALLQRTLNALQRAMLFFDRVHKHVILDSTIGTRIVAGKWVKQNILFLLCVYQADTFFVLTCLICVSDSLTFDRCSTS